MEEVVWMCEKAGLTDASCSVASSQHRQGKEMLAQNSKGCTMRLQLSLGTILSQPQPPPSLPGLIINLCVETASIAWLTAQLHPSEELSLSILLS